MSLQYDAIATMAVLSSAASTFIHNFSTSDDVVTGKISKPFEHINLF